jgi:hypothetical protein
MKPILLRYDGWTPDGLRDRAIALAVALVMVVPGVPASAQAVGAEYRISQRATLVQNLARTTIRLEYSRPAARGRSPLFGTVVHWGEVWTPGANEATVLELSTDAKLDGHPVPAGRWSVWMFPSDVGPWELLLDARDALFHTQRPELTGEGQIRFAVTTKAIEPVDVLTWSFPQLTRSRATMQMAWGRVAVPLDIEVESDLPATTIPAAEAAQYTGEWEVTFAVPPDPQSQSIPPPVKLKLRHADDGTLVADWPPGAFSPPPPPADAAPDSAASQQARERAAARKALAEAGTEGYDIILAPRARGIFVMGWMQDGLLLDIERAFHEFEFENGRAVRLTIRGENDMVFARGRRIG